MIKGGVTGTGFGIYNNSSITKSVFIPPGSQIKRAFLLAEKEKQANDVTVKLNGKSYLFNGKTSISNTFIGNDDPPCIGYNSTINAIDITNDIDPTVLSYTLQVPFQNEECLNGAYYGFYLYIVFKNPNLPKTVCNLFVNNQDVNLYNLYSLNLPMPINNNKDVGLGIETFFFCDTMYDASFIHVNNDTLGLIGGNEPLEQNCSGVSAHFSYYNDTLIGIDNSISNDSMSGTDALANIKDCVNYLDTSVTVSFSYKSPNLSGRKSNPILLLMTTYSTPCDTFSVSVPKDTTICPGVPLQLHASGGTKYEWKSITHPTSTHLSCTTCPNPIFSGDSSQVYTVRIWNTDSCSVVRPVRINVQQPKNSLFSTSPSNCILSTGSIHVNANADEWAGWNQWQFISENGDTTAVNTKDINGLAHGSYTLFATDTLGCRSKDTTVVVLPNNNTKAGFIADPISGTPPFEVQITNTSVNANEFEWFINGVSQGNSLAHIQIDTSGSYTILLVASQNGICRDTIGEVINAQGNVYLFIPQFVSPNKDNKNDTWAIKGITKYPNNEVHIFNRWGNVVFSAQDYQNDWGGRDEKTGKLLPSGTYFYTVKIKYEGKVKKLKGYLELVR